LRRAGQAEHRKVTLLVAVVPVVPVVVMLVQTELMVQTTTAVPEAGVAAGPTVARVVPVEQVVLPAVAAVAAVEPAAQVVLVAMAAEVSVGFGLGNLYEYYEYI